MTIAVIHVVDDDEELRIGVSRLLRGAGYDVRGYASVGEFLLAPTEPEPGCLLLDLQMPGPSGLALQEALQRDARALPIVFLSGNGDIASSVKAMKAGAVDFLTKPADPGALLRAVEAAVARDRAARSLRDDVGNIRNRHLRLTDRERAVFEHVVAGERNKVIARTLMITERTVKMHRAQVMAKMEADSLADLVRMAQVICTKVQGET
jgi:FixJ family two-component response regulator